MKQNKVVLNEDEEEYKRYTVKILIELILEEKT